MTESYVEILIKRKNSPIGKALRSACIFMGVLQMILYVLSKGLFFAGCGILFFVFAYFAAFLFRVEYEYLYFDKQLSVDKIFNQRKRKKIVEYDLATDLEVLAPLASYQLEHYKDMVSATKDFTSQTKDCVPYGMVVHVDKALELIKIEVNDELLEEISRIAPRKVFKD